MLSPPLRVSGRVYEVMDQYPLLYFKGSMVERLDLPEPVENEPAEYVIDDAHYLR
jgi:hypothetical protein